MARRVLDGEGRGIKKEFRLDRWFKKDFRVPLYFESVDFIIEQLRQVAGGEDPPDGSVVEMLAIMVSEDDSFTDYILSRNPANPDWEQLRRACAGSIYESYLRACEEGKWPAS
jgi:hypothetical protein